MTESSARASEKDFLRTEQLRKVAAGQTTIAGAVGLTKKQLYTIADKGYALFTHGRLDDARKIYEGLVAADPFDSVFHCHLGAIMWRSGNLDRAFEEYDLAVRYNFANIDALAGRGELLIARGDVERGVDDLSRALEHDPKCVRPSTQRARALLLGLSEAAKAKRRK